VNLVTGSLYINSI